MLRVGIGVRDITPGRDLGLIGYEFRQERFGPRNEGVLDPLRLKVLLMLPADAAPAMIITLDHCLLSPALARRLAARGAAAADTTADRVLIACSHTHSGPCLRDEDLVAQLAAVMPAATGEADPAAMAYGSLLEQRLADATAAALADPWPAALRCREVPLGLGYCRRVATPTGLQHCWNPSEQVDLAPLPQLDPLLTMVQLREIDGPRQAIVWSHGCHPVVLGKGSNVVSADWPGAAGTLVEERLPGATTFFLLGAAGDTHPWIATQNDPAGVRTVGEAAGSLLLLLARSGGTAADPRLAIRTGTARIGALDVDLAAWQLGPCRLVAAPVEAFAQLGLALRAALGSPLIVATVTGGWLGYWPDAAAWDAGGYEVTNATASGRVRGDGERLVAALIALAGR